uniref:Dynamin-related protein 3A-like n=1 Tax=Rhizophora mucronata TaxID=61149 RepID=A0A2P2MPT1_RHIMU
MILPNCIFNQALFSQILVQHIKAILPGLKSHISTALVSVAKEHASYGEITESKVCALCLSMWSLLLCETIFNNLVYICR